MARRFSGFTMIELLVTIAVVAILAAIAIPGFGTLIANNRSAALATEMLNALNMARTEAVKRGRRVSVCPTANGAACSGSATWGSNGWMVFLDGATSDTAAPVVTTVIQRWQAPGAGANVVVTKSGAAQSYVRFTARGLLARPLSNGNPVSISLRQTGCGGNNGRQLEVGLVGRINQSRSACP